MKKFFTCFVVLLAIVAASMSPARGQSGQTLVFKGLADSSWSNTSNWVLTDQTPANRVPAATDDVSIEAYCILDAAAQVHYVTVQSGASLTLGVYQLTTDSLVLEDGAQLMPVGYNYELTATVKKNITSYRTGNAWNFLALPFAPTGVAPDFEAAGMLEGDYDLYMFDQDYYGEITDDEPNNGEWRNYEFYAENGQVFNASYNGYLYANRSNTTSGTKVMYGSDTWVMNESNNQDTSPTPRLSPIQVLIGFKKVGNNTPA